MTKPFIFNNAVATAPGSDKNTSIYINLEKPADEVEDAEADADEESDEGEDQSGDDVFEFFVAVLVRRRKLVLGKIWWWTIHVL